MLEALWRDIRYGIRIMLKHPGFSGMAVFALALGIGSVVTMLSVINGAIWKGLPFEEPQELAYVARFNENRDQWDRGIPYDDLQYIQGRQTSFEGLAGYFGGTVNVSYEGTPMRYTGSRINANFLDLLGIRPILGTGFTEEQDQEGVAPVILLSYGVWQGQFGGDPGVIGKAVRINGKLGEIVGVMPEGFAFPTQDDVWIPLGSAHPWSDPERAQDYNLNVFGRLHNGVTFDQATAELTTFVAQLAEAFPNRNERYRTGSVEPFAPAILGEWQIQLMWIMTAMAGFVLLIACLNVANLLLARSTLRMKELAIRSSLGASRIRIVSQLLIESVTLSAVGALIGIGISRWATGALMNYSATLNMPFWFDFSIDLRILGFVVAITALAGIASGLVPALRASKANVNHLLKDDTRTGTSRGLKLFSHSLVVVQVAVSCVALIGAALMMRSVSNIMETDMNFDTDAVYTGRMGLFEGDYPTPEERNNFFITLKRNLEARPEIASAALYGRYRWDLIGLDWGRPEREFAEPQEFEDLPFCTYEYVSWDYFETLAIDLKGRSFNELDCQDSATPVTVINKALADTLFPGEDPIGQRFRRAPWPQELARVANPADIQTPWYTVVGIAPNMAAQGLGNQTGAEGRHYFLPLLPSDTRTFMTIAVRPTGGQNPLTLASSVREEVVKLDPNLPLYAAGTPAMIIEEDTAFRRVIANIFKIFGGLAVLLASIGIYGVMSFSVNQRIQEFGIRAALGAIPRNILNLVMKGGFIQLIIGLVVGLVGAFFATKLMQRMLYQVANDDPLTYGLVSLIFSVVALAAVFFPARRAAQVHPAQALRNE
jgi:predicted permease